MGVTDDADALTTRCPPLTALRSPPRRHFGAAVPTRRSAPRRGFSYVDLVEGLRDGRFYALKRILCHDKEDRQAALREVEMHNLFQHPNILRLEAHCMVEKGAKHEAWLLLPYVKVRGWPPAPRHAGLR